MNRAGMVTARSSAWVPHAVLVTGLVLVLFPVYVAFVGSTLTASDILDAPMTLVPGSHLIENFARGHPSDRIRFAACRARAQALAGPEERAAFFDETAASNQGFVRAMAEREARRIRAARPWYDRSPIPEAAP